MKLVNVPGAGPLGFKDTDSDEFIYATIAKIQDRLKQIDLETRPDPRDIPLGRQFTNSLKRGIGGLGATGSEAMGLGASALGFDEAATRYLETGKAKRQELEEQYPTSFSSVDKVRGISDIPGFIAESVGENVGNLGLMALTGGAGSLAARGLAKGAVEAAAARAAAQRGLAGEAAEAYATRLGNRLAPAARAKAGDTGLSAGIGTGSFGINAPESFAGIYEETGGELRPGLAFGAGGIKAILDGALPARLMRQLGARGQAEVAKELAERSTIVPESFKLRLAKEISKTAATESTTEAVQESVDIIAEQLAGAPGGFSDPKNVDRLLTAAAKGAAAGTVIGTPGAVVQAMRETPAKQPELPLNETKLAGSVGPGPAENLAAAMQKRKAKEAITEDEFQLLVQNGVLKDNPQTRASVKFAAPSTNPSLEEQTNAATANEALQADQVAQAAAAQASLQQQQQQNQQNDQVRQDALAQAQAANEQRQAREVAAYQAKQQAQQNAQPNAQANATPAPTVTPPSGASPNVPSGPQGGVPPAGVATSPPPRVVPAEQPSQQAGVGEATQSSAIAEGKRGFEQALQAFNQTKSPEAFANLTRVYEDFVQQFGTNDAYVMGQYAHAQDKMPRPTPVRIKDEGEYEPGTPRQRWNEDDFTPKNAPAFDDLSEKLQNTWAQNPPSIELADQIVRAHRQETAGKQVLEPVIPGQRVKLDTPEKEWNEQYRQYGFEPEWKKLKPELKLLWKNAHKQNSLSQNLFNHIVDIQVPAIAKSQQELLGLPYKIYAPRETGIPSDRAAIVAEKKANSTFKGYFTMPRVVDNLINLAHDIVFGAKSIARPKLGLTKEQREEESSLETKNEPKKDTKHYNRTSAADLKKLDEWVRSTLTKDAVTEYDRQLDIQRKDLAKIQSKELETKALAETAAAEAEAAPQPAAPVVKAKTPKAPPPPKAPPKPKRQQTLEQLANKRAKETEGQETELDKDVQTVQRRQTETERLADKARAHAAEVAKENERLMKQREEELAKKNARPAQYAEGVAYKPLSDKFPISREDFARALGIKTHNRAWLATDFNAELADAATRGDMPAVIKALLASKNPIIRDIALRAQATQRFLPSDRIKIKIADEELRKVDLEKGRQPGDLAGMFDGGNNTILLNSVYAGSEHTIAHEIVHGLTERIIKMPYPGNQLEGVNRLKRLYKDVLAKAKIVYKTDNLKELPYGFRSESEFIAEGLSNPEFQYLLAALPHEGKTSSMWTEFVRAIAQLLGLKDHNALTELLDIYSVMLEQGLPSNKTVSGAVTAALIGAPPPPNNNYPLVPDDLPANARVPSTVSTPPAALPQVALNRTMVGPMQQLLDAPKNSEFFINAADAAGRWGLSLLPTWNIAANARDMGFDQIGEIENSLRKAGAMKDTILKRSSDFMTKALAIAKADPAGKKAMDAFVNRASGLAIDVTRSKTPTPEFVKARGEEAAIDYLSLRAEYDKLHPKFQKLASDLVDQYRQFRDKYFEALKKSVHDQYQDDPVKADKILSGLDEKYKKFNEAYTPFVRIGDYWITYVNPDTGKDVAESYTSLGAQKTRLDELKKAGIVYVQSFKQTDFRKFSYKSGPVNQFFDEIKGNVVKALPIYKDDSPATAERIREAREDMMERLYQASLLLHPESSMLRQFGLERKGTLGYIEDTLAAYDQKAPVYATQISQVANKGEIEHQIESARKQNASNPDTKMSDIITHVAKIVYGVDTIRADDPLNKIANNVNKLGFTYYMGFNPASALVNMLQTPTVMFPLLAGEFHGLGQLKIMNTLFSNMTKIISESLGQQTYGEKLVESAEAKIDAAVAKGKTREEAIASLPEMERVFLSFRDEGILNAGDPSHDFGSVTKNGSGETSAFGKGVHAFTKYSAVMFQRAEAINREAGALATYQLMKQRLSGKAGINDQEKYAQAISKATEMVTKAHGDYQQGLAPKIFLNPAMRVIFMFKKFPAHMAALYIRLFKEMFSKADPDVRKVARIQLTGLMGMSAIFAGTMGMPFYYIVRDLMNLFLDQDEDDPYDFDFAFYNYLSDMWGQPMANRITRGWLGDLGGDVASKVGYASSPLLGGTKQLPFIGGLLGLRDGKNTASTEDDLKNYIAEAAGASAGMALQIARGVDKLAQGDVYRFLEGVAPMAAMRNIAKSIRLSTEGALTTRGEPIIEDVTLVESILQGAGITPQRLASQYQLNAWQKDAEKQILDRRQSLLNQYFNARTRGDFETASDVREEMRNFSLMNPEKGLKITEDTIAASARTRAKQSAETKAGIYLSKPFRQRFADVPVYAEE